MLAAIDESLKMYQQYLKEISKEEEELAIGIRLSLLAMNKKDQSEA
jgi:hypothetical protein